MGDVTIIGVELDNGDNWHDRQFKELAELSIRFCGTDDLQVCLAKLSSVTGWAEHKLQRFPIVEIIDMLHVVMSERITRDECKDRALHLWNEGLKWPEVSEIIDGDRDGFKTLGQVIKRYAEANGLYIRKGESGNPGKAN